MESPTANKSLYRCQSRLLKNHLADTFHLCLTEKILTDFDSGLLTGITLKNLQKAFDTKIHDFQLKKCLLLDF